MEKTESSVPVVGKTEPSLPAEVWTEPSLPLMEKTESASQQWERPYPAPQQKRERKERTISSIPPVGKTVPSAPVEGRTERTEHSIPAKGKIEPSPPAEGRSCLNVRAAKNLKPRCPSLPERAELSKLYRTPSDRPAWPRDRPTRPIWMSQDKIRVANPVPSRRNHSHKKKSSSTLPHTSTSIRPGHLDLITTLTGWSTPRWPSGPPQRTVIESEETRHYRQQFPYSNVTRSRRGDRAPLHGMCTPSPSLHIQPITWRHW